MAFLLIKIQNWINMEQLQLTMFLYLEKTETYVENNIFINK